MLTLDDLKIILEPDSKLQNVQSLYQEKVSENKRARQTQSRIPMPAIITSQKDLEIVRYFECSPNFITQKYVQGDLIFLDNHNVNWRLDIENKIVLVESADPGYDWIFAQHPKALITKYGGVASHMAIRCAELGIPAAIGCGELIFDQLTSALRISLDCKLELVLPL